MMLSRKHRGFTLVEVMIVVAIIALLAAIAIPNLLRARMNANISAVKGFMHTAVASLEGFRAGTTPAAYPALFTDLSDADPPYVAAELTDGDYKGYTIAYAQVDANHYTLNADNTLAAGPNFFVDESGVTRQNDTGQAGATDPPID